MRRTLEFSLCVRTMLILFMLASFSQVRANCGTIAQTITSAKDGNWSSTSTWVGGVVPQSCDFVIVNHIVTLDQSITVGANGTGGTGGLTINSGKSLIGASNSITLTGGSTSGNFTLTNNGTLKISGLSMSSGSPGCRFVNNGRATISSGMSPDGYSQIINSGSLTISGNVILQGSTITNYKGDTLIISGNLNLQTNVVSSTVDNYGIMYVNGTSASQALYVVTGTLYNHTTGRLFIPNGGLYEAGNNGSNNIYNDNYINVNYIETHDGAVFQNNDTILVTTDFSNGAQLISSPGSYIKVGRDYTQISKTITFTEIDGYMFVTRNFSNDKKIQGSGGIRINGTSTNTSNGTVTGTIDICDTTATATNYFDVNNNTASNKGIGASVTSCHYVKPCANAKAPLIAGNGTPCPSSTGNIYSVSSISGVSTGHYRWVVPSGWSITAGQGTTSVTVTASSGSTAGTISITDTLSCGYGYSAMTVIPSSTTPSTPGTIQGPPYTLCQGNTGYAYTISPVTGATSYTWSVPTGWTINTGQTTNSISVTAGTTSGSVSVIANNSCGSSSASTLAVSPVSAPGTPGSLSFTDNGTAMSLNALCSGQGYTAAVSSVTNATSYIWTVPSGWGSLNSPGNTASVSGTVGSSNGTISVAAYNACGTSSAASASLTSVSGTVSKPTISGTAAPCANSTGNVYTATYTNTTTLTWTVPANWTITSGQGTASITVTAGSTTDTGHVKVTAGNCSNSATSTGTFAVAPKSSLVTPSISGDRSNICQNSSRIYTIATPVTGVTYTWALPSTWTLNSGQGTSTINAKNDTTSNVTLGVTASETGYCPASSSITIFANKVAPAAAAGSNSAICSGTSASIGATTVTGSTYSWSSNPSGYSSTSSSGTPSPTVTTIYTITEHGSNGCSASNSVTVTVTPITVSNAGSNQTILCSATTATLAANSPANGTGAWSKVSGNGTITTTSSNTSGVMGLTSGTAVFKWTITNGTCTSSSTVSIKRDCPATYTVMGIVNKDSLKTGFTVATVTDPDANVLSASLTSGSVPAGMTISSINGKITVSNNSNLVAGVYPLSILTTDSLGGTTTSAIVIRVITDREAVYTASAAKNQDAYSTSDVLATVSDPDSTITSARITSGTLPSFMSLNISTGKFAVNSTPVTAGTYSFTVRTTDATGGISTPTTVITINADHEATYSTTAITNIDSLKNTTVLASPTDADGSITSAALASGNTLPAGTSLNASTGVITVSNNSSLVAGTYTFSINTVDATGGKSTVPVTISFIKDKEAVYTATTAKNQDNYNTSDVLATVSDSNGAITSARITSGTLPSFMSFNTTSGQFTTNTATVSPGSYTFSVRTTDVTGGISTPSVTIVINADREATYSTTAITNIDSLKNTTVLATPTDADGSITSAAIASGSTLPAGTGLNASTGVITVSNNASLVAGTYTFSINTVDATGGKSTVPVSLTFKTDNEATYTASAAKNQDVYSINDVLATVSDPDGSITSARITSGTLPSFMSFNTSTGKFAVNSTPVTAGTYSFTVRTTDVTGGISTPTTVITINADHEATYSTTAITNIDSLKNTTVLAIPTDADGSITSAALASGSTLPAGTSLNTSKGIITVSYQSSLVAGTYTFSINTVDATGGKSTVPVSISFIKDKEAVYTAATAKNQDAYNTGDVLATVSDSNGAITSARITSGTLPSFMSFNTSTGKFAVNSTPVTAGTYSFIVRTTDVTGGISTPNAVITINADHEAVYSINTPKYLTSYSNSDVLASVTDADGNISSATIVSGSLPAGTSFNTTTGAISVSNKSLLVAGSYQMTIKTVDATGGITSQNVTIVIKPAADVQISTVFPSQVLHNNVPFSFTVTAINNGPSTAKTLNVKDLLPGGLGLVSVRPSYGTYNSTTGIWAIDSLVLGGSSTLTFTVKPAHSGNFTNTAKISSAATYDYNSANDSSQNTVAISTTSSLKLTNTVSPGPYAGPVPVTFTLKVTNNGPDTSTNVNVYDLLPTGFTFDHATTSVGSYNATSGIWAIGNLAVGQTDSLMIKAFVNTENPGINTTLATMTYTADMPSANGNVINQFYMPKFNSAYGTLKSVKIIRVITENTKVQLENLSASSATIGFNSNATFYLMNSAGLNKSLSTPTYSSSYFASAYDGMTDYAGASGKIFSNNVTTAIDTTIITNVLTSYTGVDSLTISDSVINTFTGSGGSSISKSLIQQGSARYMIQYFYYPSATTTNINNPATVGSDNFYNNIQGITASSGISSAHALPVELISFSAKPVNGKVELKWETASEINNDHFEIERSFDASHFENIGEVSGHGTTQQQNNYETTDNIAAITSNILYYRLKQVDFDGAFKYSMIEKVEVAHSTESLKAWYNRDINHIQMLVNATEERTAGITLYDMNGIAVAKSAVHFSRGENNFQLDMNGLSNGIYVLSISEGKALKLIKY